VCAESKEKETAEMSYYYYYFCPYSYREQILHPLLDIFKSKPKPGIPRILFLLTDGEVGNKEKQKKVFLHIVFFFLF
jgi:hypothetical protein